MQLMTIITKKKKADTGITKTVVKSIKRVKNVS